MTKSLFILVKYPRRNVSRVRVHLRSRKISTTWEIELTELLMWRTDIHRSVPALPFSNLALGILILDRIVMVEERP